MIKKIKILLFIILVTQSILAQKTVYSGKLIDIDNRLPVFGATLTLNDRPICISGEDGIFNFEIDEGLEGSLKIRHLSYEPKIVLISEFTSKLKIIDLNKKTIELDEVVIGSNKLPTKKDILKKAKQRFRLTYNKEPYWSSMNYKQSIYNNSIPQGYLECNGYIFKGENNNIPVVVPIQMRRLNEDTVIANLDYLDNYPKGGKRKIRHKTPYKHIGSVYMRLHWADYGVLQRIHPLSKKGRKYFNFYIDKTVYVGDKAYHIIRFTQKKVYNNHGWNVSNMQGKLWVNTDTFNLYKINVEYKHRWYSSYIKYHINYSIFKNKLYPSKIEFTNYKYRSTGNHNIVKKGTIIFNERYEVRNSDPSKGGGSDEFIWYDVHEKYNSKYWKDYPLEDIKYKKDVLFILGSQDWDTAFKKGASQKEYQENSLASKGNTYFKKTRDEFLKNMKKDLNLN